MPNRITRYSNLPVFKSKPNIWDFLDLNSYCTITTEIFKWSMLLSRETSLITEFLKKNISIKNFVKPFYLWFYPIDIRFGFPEKTEQNRTEPNRTEYRIIPNLASVRLTTEFSTLRYFSKKGNRVSLEAVLEIVF